MTKINKNIFLITLVLFFSCSENLLREDLNFNTTTEVEIPNDEQSVSIVDDIEMQIDGSVSIPTRLQVSQANYTDRIILEWKDVYYEEYKALYYIYFSADGSTFTLFNRVPQNENSYTFLAAKEELESGVHYSFAVRAYIPNLNVASELSEVVQGWTIGKPNRFLATFRESTETVKLSWPEVEGARYYTIHRATVAPGEAAPVAVASYLPIGNPIARSEMDENGNFTYLDYSNTAGGDLIAQNDYWYLLFSYSTDGLESKPSTPARGALLAIGVPGAPTLLDVSKGIFDNAVRIMWKGVDERKNYILYRLTENDLQNGVVSGTEIKMNVEDIKEKDSYFYYYDRGVSFENGEKYYYRVAAKNDLGVGLMSEFDIDDADSIHFTLGHGFEKYDARSIEVSVTSKGFVVQWDKVLAANLYYIYRFIPSEGKRTPTSDSDWVFLVESIENSILDADSAFNLESDEVFYRIFPVKVIDSQPFILESDWTYSLSEEAKTKTFYSNGLADSALLEIRIADLEQELIDFGISDSIRIGHAGISNFASDFTVEVPQFSVVPKATQNDKNIKGKIVVSGKISDVSGLEKLNVKLVRTCYYGDEDGVFPLAEPRRAIGGVAFTKKGQPHVAGIEEFDLKNYINGHGEFSFEDPMHDFRDGKVLEGRRLIWDYGTWDREAWKDIKRQKMFDMNRAVKVNYRVRIERSGDPEWKPTISSEFQGWPCLTDIEFGHLANWMKDVTLNRLTAILIPRYAWSKTVAWASSYDQRVEGENSPGKSAHIKTWVQGLGGAGSGGVDAGYSDWEGFTFKTDQNISMTVSTDVGVKRNVGFKYSFTTPLYSGSVDLSMYCRDYNHNWGLWSDEGHFKYIHTGVTDWITQKPDVFMPVYEETWMSGGPINTGSPNAMRFGSSLGREAYDAGGEAYPGPNDADSCTYTRINLKYRPVPMNTDFAKEKYPVMNYGYID